MSIRQIKNYLTLIRFPNLFTLPSNVFAGYFSTHTQNGIEINGIVLVTLVSACLYAAGVIFNDVADRQTDRYERPNRPIPSGKITQRNAILLALLLIIISITISCFISVATIIIVFVLIPSIFLYNFVLKNSSVGLAAMGATRVLNILLGASPNLSNSIEGEPDYMFYRLGLVCISEFIYISGITAISKYETHKTHPFHLGRLQALLFLSPVIIGVYAVSIGLFNNNTWIYLFIFGSFILSMLKVVTSSKLDMTKSTLQKAISLLIIGIIVHDAVYVGGSLDSWYAGMSTFVLLVPPILLSKRFYIT
jgi:4-hydroxybenzoate polyprenyltransferase